ncbi:hypothetical protein [Arenimonas sp.]|uniref:hypothetical protein n=1 Tax=Arenimonas sp. TaxID=1872635 RepID=UPI0039E6E491
MNEDIRYKAAAAVVALANRAESAGLKEAGEVKGAQWQPVPYDEHSVFNQAKLREAVSYYEIAESIFPAAAGFGLPRAMILENMGEWDEAIAAYRAVDASGSEGIESIGIQRCEEKKAGTYDESEGLSDFDEDAEPSEEEAAMMQAMQGKSTAEILAMMEAHMKNKMAGGKSAAQPAAAPVGESAAADDAAQVALAFVNLLLDRDYKAARKLLHPDGDMSVADMKESFESMFEGEEFPTTANVFDVQTDMPNIGEDGVAWIYVNIDSDNQEAVAMVVAEHGGQLRLREVEFGRP